MRKLSLNDVVYWLIVCIQSRFSLQKFGKMSMWQDGLLFADDFLYVKLLAEKTRRRCCFVKSVYNVLLHRKFLFFNNVYLYIMP